MNDDELLNRIRRIEAMVAALHRQIVPDYPGADSFGQNLEGEEITLRAGLIGRLPK